MILILQQFLLLPRTFLSLLEYSFIIIIISSSSCLTASIVEGDLLRAEDKLHQDDLLIIRGFQHCHVCLLFDVVSSAFALLSLFVSIFSMMILQRLLCCLRWPNHDIFICLIMTRKDSCQSTRLLALLHTESFILCSQ